MTVTAADIITLRPEQEDIREAVRYAIKSGVPYTYDRMSKDAWRRVARIARGKVNESLIRRFAATLGVVPATEDKSYRRHDAFDFSFAGSQGTVKADVKTFHVLTEYIKAPRSPFSVTDLLSGVDHGTPQWHLFFPMLVPQDYKHHKDVYIFAASVEAAPDPGVAPALVFPWTAFPDAAAEKFLVDPKAIQRREQGGIPLTVTITWPEGMQGTGAAIYERSGAAQQAALLLTTAVRFTRDGIASFLAIQLDDAARASLRRSRAAMVLTASGDAGARIDSPFGADRFREVFPRQDFALHLIGWIGRDEFGRIARDLPRGASCYFYPARQEGDKHAPGTKTDNRYVLPAALQPINKLTEA